jgi:hypothetical protein
VFCRSASSPLVIRRASLGVPFTGALSDGAGEL